MRPVVVGVYVMTSFFLASAAGKTAVMVSFVPIVASISSVKALLYLASIFTAAIVAGLAGVSGLSTGGVFMIVSFLQLYINSAARTAIISK
ncbi:hypothetical protein [Mucilaginibacter pallidiroseus]|uniref:hypothetical protein n=1 Tax=Mucilaginibacter pallidiroseus TaxID=2599295 RepID=UPI001647974D|nr:hypothetical protein [Mucilaginibacter pallidiroseus]